MKVSAITYPQNINNVFSNKENFNVVSEQNKNSYFNFNAETKNYNQISELTNCYYPPFKASDRTYSTPLKHLKEIPSDFTPCKFDDITCPACGKTMMPRKKFEKFTEELSKLPPDEYLDHLGKYKKYMRPVEESVYEEILEISEKTNNKDIRTLLVDLREHKLPVLQAAQMKQIKKMKKIAKGLTGTEQETLLKHIDSLKKEIKKKNAQAPFRRKVMINKISKIKIHNPKKYKKLQEAAKAFPTSSDMNSAWIVKYSGKNKMDLPWDSYTIATRMLSSSVPNTDHIIAYSLLSNHDDIANYMAMHNGCNSQKDNKTFMQWLHEDKNNRMNYMKDYFLDVQDLIDSKKIKTKKYRNYVAYATETIRDLSNGKINVFEENEFKLPSDKKELIDILTPTDPEFLPKQN